MTADRARRLARQYISKALFRGLDDLVISRTSFPRRLRCTAIEGLDHLERARSAGKGVLLLTAHFSASRIAKRYLAAIGYPMLTLRRWDLYKGAGRLGRFLQTRYMEFQHQLVPDEVDPWDPDCTLKMLQSLRSGGLVNVHYDVRGKTRPLHGQFLGLPRRFPAGILHIVYLSGCAVIPMLCLGNGRGFRIVFSPPLDIANAPAPNEFAANLPAFAAAIERHITEHPEEWVLWNRL